MNIEEVWLSTPAAMQIAEFQIAFGHEPTTELMTDEDIGTGDEPMLFGLIEEEFKELAEARKAGDLLGVIDALQDLKYVIYGYELRMGISGEEHFIEVHQANMRKLGSDGKPIRREDGKYMKPEGWTGPDHQAILNEIQATGGIYGTA